jgi:hypothetical protein
MGPGMRGDMTVTSKKVAGAAARAESAIVARHAELQQVLDEWSSVLAAVAAAEAISALFTRHVAKENYLLLPALERSGADLAGLLAREDHLAGSR